VSRNVCLRKANGEVVGDKVRSIYPEKKLKLTKDFKLDTRVDGILKDAILAYAARHGKTPSACLREGAVLLVFGEDAPYRQLQLK
jgi:hypothetical protein